jgi:hypothetical protein
VHVPAVDLIGLGMKLDRHQAEALGAAEIKATPGDAEAVLGLAAEEVGSDHGHWTVKLHKRFKCPMQIAPIGFIRKGAFDEKPALSKRVGFRPRISRRGSA